jgi:hypothetical protein
MPAQAGPQFSLRGSIPFNKSADFEREANPNRNARIIRQKSDRNKMLRKPS